MIDCSQMDTESQGGVFAGLTFDMPTLPLKGRELRCSLPLKFVPHPQKTGKSWQSFFR